MKLDDSKRVKEAKEIAERIIKEKKKAKKPRK